MSLVAPTRAVLGGLQGVLEKAEPGCELLPSLREEWWDETAMLWVRKERATLQERNTPAHHHRA